jgi:hypothetical protein
MGVSIGARGTAPLTGQNIALLTCAERGHGHQGCQDQEKSSHVKHTIHESPVLHKNLETAPLDADHSGNIVQ